MANAVLASMELRHDLSHPTSESKMTETSKWSSRCALVVFVGAAIALSGCASRAPGLPAGVEQKIENATSGPDHANIASQYERQAAVDAAAAKRHLRYAAIYRKNQTPRSGAEAHETLARHCEDLAQTYEQAANQNLIMANLHRKLAGGVN
jgi:hypothetical protein